MGYRSDVRIKLTETDFLRLKEEFSNQEFAKDWNLFEDLDICRPFITRTYNWETDTKKDYACYYFGWNDIKWYDFNDDVKFIMDFILNCELYAFARIGESPEGDIDTKEQGFDQIGVTIRFEED